MTTFLRILRLYPLALWVGGEVFFVIVAGIAFSVLPDKHAAGLVVRSALMDLHRIGIGAAVVYLLATLGLMAMERGGRRIRLIEIILVAAMSLITLYSQLGVIPRMERDRLSIGGDITVASADNPTRLDFDRLHQRSVTLEGSVLIAGLVLIALAPIYDRRSRQATSKEPNDFS
ncbi:MAG TPA: DUF4149 domain-containing protein [Acidobacteriaceae bacterium]|nr:DUF4149 domain-containing protein [Acidobacteriaceae bacterium]